MLHVHIILWWVGCPFKIIFISKSTKYILSSFNALCFQISTYKYKIHCKVCQMLSIIKLITILFFTPSLKFTIMFLRNVCSVEILTRNKKLRNSMLINDNPLEILSNIHLNLQVLLTNLKLILIIMMKKF